jgi:hypothetical protein
MPVCVLLCTQADLLASLIAQLQANHVHEHQLRAGIKQLQEGGVPQLGAWADHDLALFVEIPFALAQEASAGNGTFSFSQPFSVINSRGRVKGLSTQGAAQHFSERGAESVLPNRCGHCQGAGARVYVEAHTVAQGQ